LLEVYELAVSETTVSSNQNFRFFVEWFTFHSLIPFLHYLYRKEHVMVKMSAPPKLLSSSFFFLTENHAMEVYWGSGGIATLIL